MGCISSTEEILDISEVANVLIRAINTYISNNKKYLAKKNNSERIYIIDFADSIYHFFSASHETITPEIFSKKLLQPQAFPELTTEQLKKIVISQTYFDDFRDLCIYFIRVAEKATLEATLRFDTNPFSKDFKLAVKRSVNILKKIKKEYDQIPHSQREKVAKDNGEINSAKQFLSMPNNILNHILFFVSTKEIPNAARISKRFEDLTKQPQFWHQLIKKDFGLQDEQIKDASKASYLVLRGK